MELLNTEWTTRKSDVSKPELSQGQKEFLHHDSSDYDSTDDEEAIARGENMRRRILGAVKINDKAREISSTLGSKIRGSRLVWRKMVTGDREKSVRQHIRDRQREQTVVRLKDKLSFMGGVLGLLALEFMVLRHPEQFWIFFSVATPILLALRYINFRAAKWLYFLIDFCYFANALCFVGLFLFPDSATLFQINFAFANGPLAWAVVAWRNGIVFHSLDKVTSVFIHIFPGLLAFSLRWYSPTPVPPMSLIPVFGYSILLYCFWQLCYFLKTEYLDREILASDPDLQTSLRWLSMDSKNGMHKLVLRISRRLGILGAAEVFNSDSVKTKIIFMFSQLVFTVLTLIPVPLLYHSFSLHVAFLVAILSITIFNGAGYYIEVFSVQYNLKFKEPVTK